MRRRAAGSGGWGGRSGLPGYDTHRVCGMDSSWQRTWKRRDANRRRRGEPGYSDGSALPPLGPRSALLWADPLRRSIPV